MNTPDPVRAAAALVFVGDLGTPELSPEDTHHLVDVLRLRSGAPVVAADGVGGYRLTTLEADARPKRRGPVSARLVASGTPRLVDASSRPIAVAFALGKRERPEWAVQKLTELGVDEIVLLETARSVVRPAAEARAHRRERLARVAREAAMQARRLRLPAINGPLPFAEALALLPAPLALAEPGSPPPADDLSSLLVGPEGGFSPDELAIVPGHVGLPGFVLRTETAAVAAATLLLAQRWRSELLAKSCEKDPLSPRSVVKYAH